MHLNHYITITWENFLNISFILNYSVLLQRNILKNIDLSLVNCNCGVKFWFQFLPRKYAWKRMFESEIKHIRRIVHWLAGFKNCFCKRETHSNKTFKTMFKITHWLIILRKIKKQIIADIDRIDNVLFLCSIFQI